MRTIFMGAPSFAVPSLQALASVGAEIVAVYTKAPRPGGRRGLELTKTPVHVKAEELGLPALTPASLRSEAALAEFRAFNADIAVVAAYGLILPAAILAAPRLGCFNLHGSLLPRWRGAAPIQRAIMAGDAETGVGLMRMEEGLDTGPVGAEASLRIAPSDTAGDLIGKLSELAARLIAENWPALTAGRLPFVPQPAEGVVYAKKIDKAEAVIDWRADAATARNLIHALSPSPGAYSEIASGDKRERYKFTRAEVVDLDGPPGTVIDDKLTIACGGGAIRVIEAQRAGRPLMSGADLAPGGKPRPGDRFIDAETIRSERRSSV